MATTEEVQIILSKDEALILFDFLRRFNEEEHDEVFQDQSEQRVFWNVECLLEKELAEPFMSNYEDVIAEARSRVRDEE